MAGKTRSSGRLGATGPPRAVKHPRERGVAMPNERLKLACAYWFDARRLSADPSVEFLGREEPPDVRPFLIVHEDETDFWLLELTTQEGVKVKRFEILPRWRSRGWLKWTRERQF